MKPIARAGLTTKRRRTGLSALLPALAFAPLVSLAACMPSDAPRAGSVGSLAPDYRAATMNGDTVSLRSLRGDVVLLNVWATWCGPCRAETPELQALHQTYRGRGLHVLGVSVDARGADEQVRAFARDFGVTYPILRDPAERITASLRVPGIPTTVLVGRDGTIVWRHVGPVSAKDPAFQQILEEALVGATSS